MLVVLVAVRRHQVLALPRVEAGGDPVLREPVAAVLVDLFGVREMGLGGGPAELEVFHGEQGLGEELIGEHDHRHLIPVGEVEGPHRLMEGIHRVGRSQDRLGEVPVAGVDGEEQIGLSRPGGQAGGRAGPLRQHDHHRGLGHAGQAQPFRHEGEAPPRGGGHGPGPRVTGPDCHVDGGDLVLGLLHEDPGALLLLGEEREDAGGRAHRIGAQEPTPGAHRAQGQGLVAVRQVVAAPASGELPRAAIAAALGSLPVSRLRGLPVALQHLLPLGPEPLLQNSLQGIQLHAQGRHQGAHRHRVGVELLARLLVGELREGDTDPPVGFLFRGDQEAALGEQRPVLPGGALVEGEEDVGPLQSRVPGCLPDPEGEAAVASPDPRLVLLPGEDRIPVRAHGLREHAADHLDALTGRAGHYDVEVVH
ncbi:MAG: hypothetical protein SCH98_07775 [Deferrisomatales bacterium]|nr:hypothetical protein [Deferrisomatales bacterium]